MNAQVMTTRKGAAYPRGGKRRTKKTQGVSRLFLAYSGIVAAVIMFTLITVKYSAKLAGDEQVAKSQKSVTVLSERIELYNTEIERMTSEEVISERAKELGLARQGVPTTVVIPARN